MALPMAFARDPCAPPGSLAGAAAAAEPSVPAVIVTGVGGLQMPSSFAGAAIEAKADLELGIQATPYATAPGAAAANLAAAAAARGGLQPPSQQQLSQQLAAPVAASGSHVGGSAPAPAAPRREMAPTAAAAVATAFRAQRPSTMAAAVVGAPAGAVAGIAPLETVQKEHVLQWLGAPSSTAPSTIHADTWSSLVELGISSPPAGEPLAQHCCPPCYAWCILARAAARSTRSSCPVLLWPPLRSPLAWHAYPPTVHPQVRLTMWWARRCTLRPTGCWALSSRPRRCCSLAPR